MSIFKTALYAMSFSRSLNFCNMSRIIGTILYIIITDTDPIFMIIIQLRVINVKTDIYKETVALFRTI